MFTSLLFLQVDSQSTFSDLQKHVVISSPLSNTRFRQYGHGIRFRNLRKHFIMSSPLKTVVA